MSQVFRTLLITILVCGVVLGGVWMFRGDTTGLRKHAVEFIESWWADKPSEGALARKFEGPASPEMFARMRHMYVEQLGAFQGAGKTLEEWVDGDEGYIELELEFENLTTVGSFDFRNEETFWKIQRFEIDLPRSSAPKRDYTDPAEYSEKLITKWAEGLPEMVWGQLAPRMRKDLIEARFQDRVEEIARERGDVAEVVRTALEDDGGDTVQVAYDLVYAEGSTYKASLTLEWHGGRWYVSALEVDGFDLAELGRNGPRGG